MISGLHGNKTMAFLSTFAIFVLVLGMTSASGSYVCNECEIGPEVLEYFHPPISEGVYVGLCTDECERNPNFTDPVKIQAARNTIIGCNNAEISCEDKAESKYQTFDGSCNNLENPSKGKSFNCQQILLPHDFSDGGSGPRKSCQGKDLPPGRVISNALHREKTIHKGFQTLLFMEWGQIIAHDNFKTDVVRSEGAYSDNCCNPYPKTNDICMAEMVPPGDPFYIGKRTCLPFPRAVVCSMCSGSSREALNKATSYSDLSPIYGSDYDTASQLRSGKDGELKAQYIPDVGELPPPTPGPKDQDGTCTALNDTHKCFLAGDARISQNVLITVIHIMFFRNHNNLARKLKEKNPHWSDEKLFLEARKISVALYQHMTFAYYLPNVLGRSLMSKFNLEEQYGDGRTTYNPEMDGTSLLEVGAVAHRYGHSLVPNTVKITDRDSGTNGSLYLKEYFFYPFDYYRGLLESMTLGMTKKRMREHDLYYSSALRNWFNHRRYEKTFGGVDLAAITINRGRDLGIPGYTSYLKYLFNHEVQSFCDLWRFIPPEIILELRKHYKSVHDIDLYTGSLSEYDVEGSLLGPTMTTLSIIHYQKTKFGDRYYFEHGSQAGSFSKEQLLEIKKMPVSWLICTTTKVSKIQEDAFHPPSESNPLKPCESFPDLDLSAWAEY